MIRLIFLLVAVGFCSLACRISHADETATQLAHANEQLAEVTAAFDEAMASVEYTDPKDANAPAWQSQSQWEKLEIGPQFLPADIHTVYAKAAGDRTAEESSMLRTYFLCFVNESTSKTLRPLAERKRVLREIVAALESDGHIPDSLADRQVLRFFRLRFLEPYRLYSDDSAEVKPEVIDCIDAICRQLAARESMQWPMLERIEKLVAKGSKDPFIRAYKGNFAMRSRTTTEIKKAYWNEADEIVKQLDESFYPQIAKFVGRVAKARLSIDEALAIDPKLANSEACIAKAHETVLAALRGESHCPEHREALNFLLNRSVEGFDMETNQRIVDTVEKSDLPEWMKLTFQQSVYLKLYTQADKADFEDGNEEQHKREVKKLFRIHKKHALSAHRMLPLSQSPAASLMAANYSARDGASCRKWFGIATKRRPGCYWLYRSYMVCVIYGDGDRTVEEFFEEMATSKNLSAGVPWMVYDLLNYARARGDGEIWGETKVADALAVCVARAEEAKIDPAKVKEWNQLLNLLFLNTGQFEKAFPVACKIKGDFGRYDRFDGKLLTIPRVAVLGNELAARVDKEIDAGKIDVTQINAMLDELSLARMDFDEVTSIYIDELSGLLESIRDFENGKWANLTTQNELLYAWRASESVEAWKSVENGIRCSKDHCFLAWRWPVKGPYILEADIEVEPTEKYRDKKQHFDGFSVSRNEKYPNPFQGVHIDGGKRLFRCDRSSGKECQPWGVFNESGSNRLRVRVWEDFTECTINGVPAGQYVVPSPKAGYAILKKDSEGTAVTFSNVRICKLRSEPPTKLDQQKRLYWTGRLTVEPEAADLLMARGKATGKKLKRKAIADFVKAQSLAPNSTLTSVALVDAYIEFGMFEEAKTALLKAIDLFPRDMATRCQLALVMSDPKQRETFDAAEATRQAQAAYDIAPGYHKWKLKELLAVTHAANGLFDKAVKLQEEAINTNKDDANVPLMQEMLDRYRKKKTASWRNQEYFSRYVSVSQKQSTRKPIAVKDGLVGMWTFDTDTTNAVSGKQCEIIGSPEMVEGRTRGSILLGESNKSNLLVASKDSSFDASKPFTVTFWIKTFDRGGRICGLSYPPGSKNVGGMFIGVDGNRIFAKLNSSKYGLAVNAKKQLKRYNWQHVAVSYDGSGTLQGFHTHINGNRKSMTNLKNEVGEKFEFEKMVFQFGSSQGKLGMGCMLDEVRVYNRMLSDDEVNKVKSYVAD